MKKKEIKTKEPSFGGSFMGAEGLEPTTHGCEPCALKMVISEEVNVFG